MRPNIRSLSGIVLMLGIIPIFAGLLACMPVPIGDPERSRIDPDLNGVWAVETSDDAGPVYFLRPYDKRTWLILGTEVRGESLQTDTAQQVIDLLGGDDVETDSVVVQKAWLKKLGGATFMTWESVGSYDEDGLVLPEYWMVWKLEKNGPDEFSLRLVNGEHDVFADLDELDDDRGNLTRVRRQWERALRKAVDNPELFADDDEVWVFHRVPDDALEDAFSLFSDVVEFE